MCCCQKSPHLWVFFPIFYPAWNIKTKKIKISECSDLHMENKSFQENHGDQEWNFITLSALCFSLLQSCQNLVKGELQLTCFGSAPMFNGFLLWPGSTSPLCFITFKCSFTVENKARFNLAEKQNKKKMLKLYTKSWKMGTFCVSYCTNLFGCASLHSPLPPF